MRSGELPELTEGEQFEIGVKQEFFDDKASATLAFQDIEVSFAYACCGGISIDTENSFSGSIMKDIGIRRPKSQAAVDGGLIILSEERIPDIDADVLFLSVDDDEDSEQVLANWQQKPLWNQLKAVQNKQVYIVNHSIWRAGDPIAANLVIDDLYNTSNQIFS